MSASSRRYVLALKALLAAAGFVVLPVLICGLDVSLLGPLVAPAEQQHQAGSILSAVNAISGPVIDTQLEDSVAYGFPVAAQSSADAVEPPEDAVASLVVSQCGQP